MKRKVVLYSTAVHRSQDADKNPNIALVLISIVHMTLTDMFYWLIHLDTLHKKQFFLNIYKRIPWPNFFPVFQMQ